MLQLLSHKRLFKNLILEESKLNRSFSFRSSACEDWSEEQDLDIRVEGSHWSRQYDEGIRRMRLMMMTHPDEQMTRVATAEQNFGSETNITKGN
jgi:hypothetical protein